MAPVWAHRVGDWVSDPGSGWSHTIKMNALSDLMASMNRAKLKDREGSELLCGLSKELPGRTNVAFELYGYMGAMGNMPGRMEATDASIVGGDGIPKSRMLGKLSPWGKFAKRAQNGQIVHYPLLEQSARAGKKCANPGCPGHGDAQHSCSGW